MATTRSNRPAALVTGGSRGIGRGIAVELARAGWDVGINYSSNAAAAQEAIQEVKAAAPAVRAEAVQGDIATTASRKYLVDFMLQTFGRLDALVNNAGVAPEKRADLLETGEASYDRVMDINLKGPFFLTQLAARTMLDLRKAGTIERGYIVNISSISAYTASVNRGEYCLSKAGMSMLTALFAARLAQEAVGVFEVRPGVIATDMTGPVKEKYDKLIAEGLSPIRRWGTPEDIGRCVAAILRGDFPFSTGQVFDVDGGFHLRVL
ncbi:MAG: 3-ketoacyl-ACP reductase [Planctomycetota bacterium]|nr:3-ketoacyl-ACP reductase [Planctomycetota bacterium]